MQVNEEKRKKFMEFAGKRVNNVLHDIQILEPMSRSTSYDFTRQDVEEMFNSPGGKERYWDEVHLKYYKNDFKIAVRECEETDVVEIDTFNELKAIDKSYDV